MIANEKDRQCRGKSRNYLRNACQACLDHMHISNNKSLIKIKGEASSTYKMISSFANVKK